jgi:hypothetical protein
VLATSVSQMVSRTTRAIFRVLILTGASLYGAHAAEIDRPSHADALNQVMEFMARVDATLGGDQMSSVSNFKYANGYQEDANHYVVIVNYRRVFKVGLQDISNATIDKTPNPNNLGGLLTTGMLSFLYGDFTAGDWFEEARSYRFLRTETGWLIVQLVGDTSILASHVTPKPPKTAAQPFNPNAALLIDYSKAGCRAPKGTMIMDFGGAPGFSAMDRMDKVVIDPKVCPSTTLNVSRGDIGDMSLEQSEALGQSPDDIRNRFIANAVLNRDYPWLPECTFPKGTRIKVLGADKTLRNFYSVQPDPTVCPHTPAASDITVPPDAIESIR